MEKEKKIDKAKAEILNIVFENPGILSVLLFDRFEGRFSRSHILYFIRSLEKDGRLKTYKEGKYVYCYLPDDKVTSAKAAMERKRHMLENLNRKTQERVGQVLTLIRSKQGITKAGIAKDMKLYRNTAGYYVDLLSKHDFVQIKDINHRKCCFTTDYKRDFTYLNDTERKLLEIIEKYPNKSERELRAITDQRQQLLYRNLKSLLKKDKILREKKGTGVYRYSALKTPENEFNLFLDEEPDDMI